MQLPRVLRIPIFWRMCRVLRCRAIIMTHVASLGDLPCRPESMVQGDAIAMHHSAVLAEVAVGTYATTSGFAHTNLLASAPYSPPSCGSFAPRTAPDGLHSHSPCVYSCATHQPPAGHALQCKIPLDVSSSYVSFSSASPIPWVVACPWSPCHLCEHLLPRIDPFVMIKSLRGTLDGALLIDGEYLSRMRLVPVRP